MTSTQKLDGRRRVLIENVQPEIDCGRFPIKRVIGERVDVEADVFNDSHYALSCLLRYRHESEAVYALTHFVKRLRRRLQTFRGNADATVTC